MWSSGERILFTRTTEAIHSEDFVAALSWADTLGEKVKNDPAKFAYVLGCKKAVALRHLKRPSEAMEAFDRAYEMALDAKAYVIAAYVRNDQAFMYEKGQAIQMIEEALELLHRPSDWPDPTRMLIADEAYFNAGLAYKLYPQEAERARTLVASSRGTLERYAREMPRYKQAYLLTLFWEWKMYKGTERHIHTLRLAKEVARQGRFGVVIGRAMRR
jgi:tetratricopeptide (TPR) repeat protein